ncbi:MAG TPA: hypothetical protein PK280_10105 [Planctomycetota bacterium]|nr:hypothetical protein [Planctomycetota bacterium]
MSLLYKDDWDQAMERSQAWWAHEHFGRCGLWVTARRRNAPDEPRPVAPADPDVKWTDLDYWARRNEWDFRRTFYGGEAVPIWDCGYPGRECVAAFLGAAVTLGPDTGWIDPILGGEGLDVGGLRIEAQNRWWRFTLDALKFGAEAARGRACLATGAFGGAGDTLAGLRGSERLLYDLVERPDEVRAAELALMDMWIDVFRQFHAVTAAVNDGGSTGWFPLWGPGKFYAAQCDFAYMISPAMFRDIFLPAVARQTEFLDQTVYHVDGVGNFNHVDALCELPRLQALQILPGAGKPSPLHYMDVLRKVQAAGKNLHISIPAQEVRPALEQLSARGLFIATSCETEEEARALLRNAEKWSRDRG